MNTEIKVGDKFETFYGNGTFAGIALVKKVTSKSIFVGPENKDFQHREAFTSVARYLTTGLWKKI